MDSKEHGTPSCETLSTTSPEAVMNLQISTQTFKVEIKEETTAECRDETESPCNDYMHPSKPLESPEYGNYYDSKIYMWEELKQEFPEDDCPQSDCTMDGRIVSENRELLSHTNKQKVEIENTEEEFSLILKEVGVNSKCKYQITIKTERLEEPDITDSSGATSVHYDVLVTPQEVKCKFCARIFNNNYNLLKHNNDHIKIEINTPADNDINELHQRQYCGKGFINYDNMLVHVTDVHSENNPKCKICGKQFNSVMNLERHFKLSHKLKKFQKQVTAKDMKCIYCNAAFKRKSRLNNHMKLCRNGKEDEDMKYKCALCEGIYKSKHYLTKHINRMHYDYGRTFDCWCGKEYRTPEYLREHMRRHDGKMKNRNNAKVQCDYCHKFFKTKHYLLVHIKTVHDDYCKLFECWCGKQFRTPVFLNNHKRRHTDGNINDTNNVKLCRLINHNIKLCLTDKEDGEMKYKCELCKGIYKSKHYLILHMKRMHYDYGRTFACSCGKQFRSPVQLSQHMWHVHGGKMKDKNKSKVQCDTCQKIFKSKYYLLKHNKNVHYDYGKAFECWCGKQFRTPKLLNDHKRRQHDGIFNDKNNDKSQSVSSSSTC